MHSKKYTFVDEHVCFSRIRTSEFFVCAQDFLILLWHQSSSLETFCLDICLLLGGLLMGGELRLLIRTCLISIEEHLLIGDEVRMLLGLVYWWQRVYPFLPHSKFRELLSSNLVKIRVWGTGSKTDWLQTFHNQRHTIFISLTFSLPLNSESRSSFTLKVGVSASFCRTQVYNTEDQWAWGQLIASSQL